MYKVFQQNQVLDYLDYLTEGMKKMCGDAIKLPERHHADGDDLCMYLVY